MARAHWRSLFAKTSSILRQDSTFLTCLGQVTEIEIMDHLHLRTLRDNADDSDSHYLLALATLGIAT
jgi:hypothetical protein